VGIFKSWEAFHHIDQSKWKFHLDEDEEEELEDDMLNDDEEEMDEELDDIDIDDSDNDSEPEIPVKKQDKKPVQPTTTGKKPIV